MSLFGNSILKFLNFKFSIEKPLCYTEIFKSVSFIHEIISQKVFFFTENKDFFQSIFKIPKIFLDFRF